MNTTLLIIIATSLSLLTPILLDGIERKLKATLQSRIGPPITQTFYDLLKLLVKEFKPIHTGLYVVYCLASSTSFMITALLFTLLYTVTRDIMYIVYASALFAVSASSHMAVPLLVPNPFSQIGAWREIMIAILNEAFFLASIALCIALPYIPSSDVLPALRATLSMIILVISGYTATGRPPFDIAEAEPEIASGISVELSGPVLALNMYIQMLKRFTVKAIVASLFVNILTTHSGLIALILVYALVVMLWILFTVISALLGRTRVDVGPLTLAKVYFALILVLIIITALMVV